MLTVNVKYIQVCQVWVRSD